MALIRKVLKGITHNGADRQFKLRNIHINSATS